MKKILYLIVAAVLIYLCLENRKLYIENSVIKNRELSTINLVDDFNSGKDYLNAREGFKNYISSDKHAVNVLVDVGVTYAAQNDWKRAFPYFKVGLDLGSRDALKYLATCEIQLAEFQDFAELVPNLKSAAKDDPEDALLLAMYACKMNDKELFVYAEGITPDGFFKTRPQELQDSITACDYFKLDDLKQKYLALQKTVGQPPATTVPPAASGTRG